MPALASDHEPSRSGVMSAVLEVSACASASLARSELSYFVAIAVAMALNSVS